jgi:DNA repair protein RecO
MSAVKTQAVVLKTISYGETSSILYLFSESHGLIHGIAKGIRRKAPARQIIERGFIIELLAYVRPHRELHTLGSIQTLAFFPSTRTSLVRCAVRDAAFELVLAAITVADPHPELFDFIKQVLENIESRPESMVFPWLLWRFYIRFAGMMGFAPVFDTCICCGRAVEGEQTYLNAGKGGIECRGCSKSRTEQTSISDGERSFLCGQGKVNERARAITHAEGIRITRLLDSFCRYHFDVRSEPKALEFLEKILNGGGRANGEAVERSAGQG